MRFVPSVARRYGSVIGIPHNAQVSRGPAGEIPVQEPDCFPGAGRAATEGTGTGGEVIQRGHQRIKIANGLIGVHWEPPLLLYNP